LDEGRIEDHVCSVGRLELLYVADEPEELWSVEYELIEKCYSEGIE
jgi:hypothetical protein